MKDLLYNSAVQLQKTLENELQGNLSGTCYLIGHCLSEIFKSQGFKSKCVSGTLSLKMHNSKKYAKYGASKLKGETIGNYHTWCEVIINNQVFIIDPTLKYNIAFLKVYFKIKIDRKIPNIILTSTKKNFYYQYTENNYAEKLSKKFLKKIDKKIIKKIIRTTTRNINNPYDKISA
jgi:hypothetical protein